MKDFDKLCQVWDNRYLLGLQITDHIDELKAKDTYMKMRDIPKEDNEFRRAFEKECIDLYLLLSVYFNTPEEQEKVENRIQNILRKMNYNATGTN